MKCVYFLILSFFISLSAVQAAPELKCKSQSDWYTFSGHFLKNPEYKDEEVIIRNFVSLEIIQDENTPPPFNYILRVNDRDEPAKRFPDKPLTQSGEEMMRFAQKRYENGKDVVLGKDLKCVSDGFVFYCEMDDKVEDKDPIGNKHFVLSFSTSLITTDAPSTNYLFGKNGREGKFNSVQTKTVKLDLGAHYPDYTVHWFKGNASYYFANGFPIELCELKK